MVIRRQIDGVREEIATNTFLNDGLRRTGRYNATAEVKNGGKDFIVTITISGITKGVAYQSRMPILFQKCISQWHFLFL